MNLSQYLFMIPIKLGHMYLNLFIVQYKIIILF